MLRRPLLLPLLAAATLALGACGGSSGDDTTTSASATTVTDGAADAERLDADRAKDAVGEVSVCGPISTTRSLLPRLRRFDAADDRLQVSTLGLPDGTGAQEAFQQRQAIESKDCDVYVAGDDAEARALAARGGLFDLTAALKTWVARPGGAALQPVVVEDRAFALPLRADGVDGVLVISVHGRNPGGALEVVRELGGARAKDAS